MEHAGPVIGASSMPPIYLVDQDEAARNALRALLVVEGYAVWGFESGERFLERAPSLVAGCAIIEFDMPGLDGISVQRRLADAHLDFPVIILTGSGSIQAAVAAMRAGAVDFLQKPAPRENILATIGQATKRLPRKPSADSVAAAHAASLKLLTLREYEVLEGVVAGLSNKMIASGLSLSPRTVEIHRARVMDKMQAHSRSELIRLAVAAGVVPAAG
jgi:two-component system response regulator FixJ